MCKDVDE